MKRGRAQVEHRQVGSTRTALRLWISRVSERLLGWIGWLEGVMRGCVERVCC